MDPITALKLVAAFFIGATVFFSGWKGSEQLSSSARIISRVLAAGVGFGILSVGIVMAVAGRADAPDRDERRSAWEDEQLQAAVDQCASDCMRNTRTVLRLDGKRREYCEVGCDCIVQDMVERKGMEWALNTTTVTPEAEREGEISADRCFEAHPEWEEEFGLVQRPGPMPSDGYGPSENPTKARFDVAAFAEPMPAFYPMRRDYCPTHYQPRGEWCLHPDALDWSEERLNEATEHYSQGAAPPMIQPRGPGE